MSRVVYLLQNPNSPTQMYALWDTGRIDPFGGALPVYDAPSWFTQQPPPAVALHITDWAGPAGYTLDYAGAFQSFGGAPDVGAGDFPYIADGVPYTGGVPGVSSGGPPKYVDFNWNPDGSGQGYVLDLYGQLYNFGGATACPRSGPLWTQPYAKRLEMQWTPKRSVILDMFGGRNQDFPFAQLPTDGYYDLSRDWARDLVITNWGNTGGTVAPSGYLLTASGVVTQWGPSAPQDVFGEPFVGNAGTQVGLGLISPADPLTLVEMSAGGLQKIWTASTAPTVLAGGGFGVPADPTTDTTRPSLTWSYSDPQRDSQTAWQLLVFSQAFVAANTMTKPLAKAASAVVNVSGTDSTTRGLTCPVDLANGSWRMYVRAQDTSLRWSPWSNRGWAQNVAVPAAPSNLLATVDGFHVNLVLTTVTVEADQLALFEASDDAGLTWTPVRGAEAVPLATTTYAVDWDIPLGLPRTYRARIYFTVPRIISLASPERTITVEQYVYVITAVDNPDLGGRFIVTALDWNRPRSVGVFEPLGALYAIVLDDGAVRARRGTVSVHTHSHGDYDRLYAVLSTTGTLLVRDQFGQAVYCRVTGDWEERLLRAAPTIDEATGIRHAHVHGLPLIEVARPTALPAVGA